MNLTALRNNRHKNVSMKLREKICLSVLTKVGVNLTKLKMIILKGTMI